MAIVITLVSLQPGGEATSFPQGSLLPVGEKTWERGRGRGTQQPAPRSNAFAYVTLCGRESILAFPTPSIGKWYPFHIPVE